MQNNKQITKNTKEYFINRLNLIFNGSLDKLKNSFDKNKKDENNDLIKIFKFYQEKLQKIKKIDKQDQIKRLKLTNKSYSNLLDSFRKM